MNNYFEENEENDFGILTEFNNQTNLFQELHQTPKKHYYDVSGKTRDGRTVTIELKRRNLDLIEMDENISISGISGANKEFFDDNILLSAHKGLDMIFDALYDSNERKIPLHITLLNNAIVMHDLLNLKDKPKRYASVKSYSTGYQKMEYGMKYGLMLNGAIIYKLIDGKYIRYDQRTTKG